MQTEPRARAEIDIRDDKGPWRPRPTLEGADYTSRAVYDDEREKIWWGDWVCVGRNEEVQLRASKLLHHSIAQHLLHAAALPVEWETGSRGGSRIARQGGDEGGAGGETLPRVLGQGTGQDAAVGGRHSVRRYARSICFSASGPTSRSSRAARCCAGR